jgi:hypothetical protein
LARSSSCCRDYCFANFHLLNYGDTKFQRRDRANAGIDEPNEHKLASLGPFLRPPLDLNVDQRGEIDSGSGHLCPL